MEELKLNTIEEAIADFREGKFVIVVDDEDRENEGDLIVAAEKITPEQVNFMLKHARGVLCAPITISRCKELELPHQVDTNTSVLGTPFTVTVDKLEGCSTGVSIHDRAATIRALADPTSTPETFGRPGHTRRLSCWMMTRLLNCRRFYERIILDGDDQRPEPEPEIPRLL
jgi:3,4-dihydroxy 2-butanone 4-phosphate synthase/GTP cyclohydrolase II